MSASTSNKALQFSLAWLLFWTLVCAVLAGITRAFADRGPRGLETIATLAILGLWLGTTFAAIYLRIFLQRRWNRSAAMRQELEQLVKQRRKEQAQSRGESISSPSPGP